MFDRKDPRVAAPDQKAKKKNHFQKELIHNHIKKDKLIYLYQIELKSGLHLMIEKYDLEEYHLKMYGLIFFSESIPYQALP